MMPDATDPFKDHEWRAYCTVNRLFATKVMEVYETAYMIWVHDYHLLLLPSYVLRRHRTAHIGLFVHSPFPASDVFRTLAVRDELLRAMLNADLVGFLLFEYTRNFLTCCKRMLGLEYEFRRGGFLGVEYGGRHVMVQVPACWEAARRGKGRAQVCAAPLPLVTPRDLPLCRCRPAESVRPTSSCSFQVWSRRVRRGRRSR